MIAQTFVAVGDYLNHDSLDLRIEGLYSA